MPDADKTHWKDVKRKTADELRIFQFQFLFTTSLPVVFTGKAYFVVAV
jgi:hypothetical protein